MSYNIDYIAGINGLIQTIVGHPLDSLKTWKQSNLKLKLNVKSLYKGVSYPLLTNSILNHVQFNLMEQTNNYHINYLLTGIFSGLFLAPIEYFKIRKQNNLKISIPNGINISLIREIPGVIFYFGTLRNFKTITNINSELIAGGVAGSISWFLTYPLDTIKTRIQSDIPIKEAIKLPYYNGISYCLIRAFIANGLGYYSYVKLTNIININK
ncbi:putative mitochondrial carrier protein [Cafeteria roenbergensis virus]|uniref:Putative mitochondrial carrier protein n=1 Tax=Cafeteria roenbergensis virus (strain BV-PW1) TaxID=693272 RepID=E3T5M0_CROVB|nr:putative mitochondrial carrier protein [Cafeteria roenbergensis virus BV-PW1]ADO67483.1 putative mitochondrial carrier protein [Cafeteria roenbergensis virus BV-PW1]